MGITKNYQSENTLRSMISNAFPDKSVAQINELNDGYCNLTYRIMFTDGEKVILKIAPENASGTLRNEKNMMDVEIESMEYMQSYPEIPVAKVIYSDCTKTICTGDYFFMEFMSGDNLGRISGNLNDSEKSAIYREIGQIVCKLGCVKGDKFGIFGQVQYDTLYDFVHALFANLYDDAVAISDRITLPFTLDEMIGRFSREQYLFSEVTTPSLIHWDFWDGNIFVINNHVSAVIDWERTMWAEPIMCDRFRRHTITEALLSGFGKTVFSDSEKKRLAWYDVLLYTTMIVEEVYRKYDDNGTSSWVCPFLEAAWSELSE